MTDLNKPVKITHDSETGDISAIETFEEYLARTNNELRNMAIAEEEAGKAKRGRQYDILPKVDADTSLKQFSRELEVRFPSVEQMKREVETGEFSPESIAIANSILENAENIENAVDDRPRDERAHGIHEQYLEDRFGDADTLDWWATQEHFGAPLPNEREKSFIEKQTSEIMARVTKGITPASAHFKKIETSAKKTARSFKKLNKALPQKPAPGAKLQHRPFLILAAIRDEL